MTSFEDEVLQRLTAMETTLNSLDKALNGNGQPGLLKRTAIVETKLDERTSKKTTLGVGAGGGAMIAVLIDFIKSYMDRA